MAWEARNSATNTAAAAKRSTTQEIRHEEPSSFPETKSLLDRAVQRSTTLKLVDDRPIKTQFIWNTVLQICGLIAAFLFGVFSILAYLIAHEGNSISSYAAKLSQIANKESFTANQFALLTYCQSNTFVSLLLAVWPSRYSNEFSN
jgi:hypothetical protein